VQLLFLHGVLWIVDKNLIPARKSAATGLIHPENLMVVLFTLSTTLWLLAFVGYYLSIRLSGSFSALARAAQFFQARHLVTLFPDGSPTSRATFPR
jgi:hypothetical protein